jgi:hypothetical protein
LHVPFWITSACFADCIFLNKAVHALLLGTREGNREQACWTIVRRIREWENPTWKVLFCSEVSGEIKHYIRTHVVVQHLLAVFAWWLMATEILPPFRNINHFSKPN